MGRWISPDTLIPDFSNPQNLNRYSYVLNRPLILTDPSGHIAAEEEEEALGIIEQLCDAYGVCINIDFGYVLAVPTNIWQEGQWELYELQFLLGAHQMHDQVKAGEMTSLDYLANLSDFRASFGHTETFVDDMSMIILGFAGIPAIFLTPLNRNAGVRLSDSGFNDTFVFPDGSTYADGSNQPNHFWVYVHNSYTTGMPRLIAVQNWVHEHDVPLLGGGPGAHQADEYLGYNGIALGMLLKNGCIDANEVGNWIRRELGPSPQTNLSRGRFANKRR